MLTSIETTKSLANATAPSQVAVFSASVENQEIAGGGISPAEANVPASDQAVSDNMTATVLSHPIHIYPKAALELIRLKCPTMRSYCDKGITGSMRPALISGLNQTLSLFDGGSDAARTACSSLHNFDPARFDTDMAAGALPDVPEYSCTQIRVDGSTTCPTGGCPLPTGAIAATPADLFMWDCDIAEVRHTVIAKSVAASQYADNIVRVRDQLCAYNDGIYTGVSEITLQRDALRHLGDNDKLKHATEIAKLMVVQCARTVDVIRPNPNVICFENGTLNVTTRRLEPHSPTHMLLNRIPHAYSADAGCEGFMAFLNSIWTGDHDRDVKTRLVRQWIGYLLVADSRMIKMLILKGEGSNGKTVLTDLIEEIIGEENISSAMLDRLREPYVRATMEGKLLNTSADLPKIGITADGDLKALIGGNAIEVSPKFKPSYTIKPYVRLMAATNNMPDCVDTSDAYFNRLMILTFNRKYTEQERNPHLLESLTPEIPGIIAWAVEGLYDLREQGHFSIPPSSEQAVKIYREEISPVKMFADECLVASPERPWLLPKDIYTAFKTWSRERGLDAGNLITLGRELSKLGFEQYKSGKTWRLVRATEAGQEYFRPPQIVPETPQHRANPGLALAA